MPDPSMRRRRFAASAALLVVGASFLFLAFGSAGLFLLGFPLYARLLPSRLLDHDGRGVVYERIRNDPGVSAKQIASTVDFGWSTLTYHLRVLERSGWVASVRDGRYRRYFDRHVGLYANGRKRAAAMLKNPTTDAVGRLVRNEPGLFQKEVCARLGLAPSSVGWHVARLERVGLLEKRREGHHVRYVPGPAWDGVAAAEAAVL